MTILLLRPLPSLPGFTGELRSIVILAQEKIGDAILLTPLIYNLRHSFRDLEITVVVFSSKNAVLEKDQNINQLIIAKSNPFAFLKLFRQKFDLLFNTKDHPSFTFLLCARLLRARYKVGFNHPKHAGFFNQMLKVDFYTHIIDKYCALLDHIGLKYSARDCRPYLPSTPHLPKIDAFIKSHQSKELIGINLSAGEQSREWSLEKWTEFAQFIQLPTIVFAMPDRLYDKRSLENSFKHVLVSPETRSIFDIAHLIRCLKALISPDTSLIHVASCYNINVIGLYRYDRVHHKRFYPYLTQHEALISSTNRIEDIPVTTVANALKKLVSAETISI